MKRGRPESRAPRKIDAARNETDQKSSTSPLISGTVDPSGGNVSRIKKAGAALVLVGLITGGCGSSDKLLASDGSAVSGSPPPDASAMGVPPPAALGEPCINSDEWVPSFPGFSKNEINIEDRAAQCETNICLLNHFQGRASCPYGQAQGTSGCLLPDNSRPVTVGVAPQLVSRQANVASICSCRCDGDGPGPYCTCPESMQCQRLIEDLHLGGSELAGSYCIPKGSQYDPKQPSEECVEPNCGPANPH